MYSVLVRTVVIYFVAVFSMRFMGKRQVGEMQLSELITAVLLSELLAAPAVNPDIPLIYGVVPLAALVSLEVIVSYLVMKSRIINGILDNRPSVIIEHGVIKQSELTKLRIGISELISSMRHKNIADISQVDCAILEPDGTLSVFTKDAAPLMFTVICDGDFCKEGMRLAATDEQTLTKMLGSKHISVKDVFVMNMGQSGTYIVKKEKAKK